uniref:Taperin n=1 Tax=Mastacembelus armatus TaxID=205130 RepID=A0A3Q3RJ55_9TELE
MPAWKREILERRKAKGGVSGGAGAAETSPGGAGPQRVNGELTGNVNGSSSSSSSGGPKSGPSGVSGRNYTITTASQHFANNKETRTSPREDDTQESLVLQESLGPLEENPFIKLEKERKRRQDRENAARPVQHILELYGSVPGIRTIRAENIIIIESDPDCYFPEAATVKTGSNWQQNGVSSYSSLNDLLDRRGSAVTEIRAKEVVIYDTTLSKSEENLSTLGRPDHEVASYEAGEGQGRVSRMLQKFDSNYGKLQKKSHSTENLLDLDCSAGSRPRLWPKPQSDLVPKPRPSPSVSSPGSSQPSSPVFQSPRSSKPKPQPAVSEPGSPQRPAGAPQSVSSFRQWFEDSGSHGVTASTRDEPDRAQTKPTRERDWEGAEVPPKPKVPCSPENRCARAESPSNSISLKVLCSSPDFEIRPSPKPDLARIPAGDTQARALANLRLQSRNSFTVIPKRHLGASSATSSPVQSGPVKSSPSHRVAEVPTPGVPTSHAPTPTLTPSKRKEERQLEEKEVERVTMPSKLEPSPSVATSPEPFCTPALTPASSSTPALSSPTRSPAILSSPPVSPPATSAIPSQSLAPSPVPPASSMVTEESLEDQLPVTNIDDIDVEPERRVPVPSPMVHRRKANTFTVVPKRRVEPEVQPSSPEPQQDAPYAQLGSLLKKRYPAVEEIEVIGGYLSLAKSCLLKTGSTGKKLKISFNESSLQSTYEYPSESSVNLSPERYPYDGWMDLNLVLLFMCRPIIFGVSKNRVLESSCVLFFLF